MLSIPLSSIIVSESRQRQAFDGQAAADLSDSIGSIGLISPIILRESEIADKMHLVAGERRFRAVSLLATLGQAITFAGAPVPLSSIPFINFGDLTEIQQQEIEYAENAIRKDLTWQENAQAFERLHTLRTGQALAVGGSHTVRDTAMEVFGADSPTLSDRQHDVKQALVVSRHMDRPEVAKAASLKEALKIIRRAEDTTRREHLATVTGRVVASERFKLYHSDALTWMKTQANEQFDIILTDPPYGMGADTFGDAAGRMAGITHEYKDGADETRSLLAQCIPEWFRLAKPQAHLYLWCDIDMFTALREMCRLAGWWTFRTPLINLKPEGGRVPWPEHGPRRAYELCLYAVKGKRPVTSIRNDYFESRLSEGNFGHGAQKPVEAYVELLRRSGSPGDSVLDTFAGTGTIFPAAEACGMYGVGVELEAAAYGICLERIAQLK